MRQLILVVVGCIAPLAALATNKPPAQPDPVAMAEAAAKAVAASNAIAAARTGDVAVNATLSASPSVSIVTERGAPPAYAPDVFPTAPCLRGMSLGASGTGGAFSFGRTREIEGCVRREQVRIAAEMGMVDHARYLWCNLPEVLTTFGDVQVCMNFGQPQAEPEATKPPDCSALQSQIDAANERTVRVFEECTRDKGSR